jgi:hypothetical protein
MLGRKMTPATEIVRQFDAQCETAEALFELVIFLDGRGGAPKPWKPRLRLSGKVGGGQSGMCLFQK